MKYYESSLLLVIKMASRFIDELAPDWTNEFLPYYLPRCHHQVFNVLKLFFSLIKRSFVPRGKPAQPSFNISVSGFAVLF